jgi:hypothetical protein
MNAVCNNYSQKKLASIEASYGVQSVERADLIANQIARCGVRCTLPCMGDVALSYCNDITSCNTGVDNVLNALSCSCANQSDGLKIDLGKHYLYITCLLRERCQNTYTTFRLCLYVSPLYMISNLENVTSC